MTKPDTKKAKPSRSAIVAESAVPDAIGRQLRKEYEDILTEPIPSDLTELVSKLAKESDKAGR